MAVKFEVWDKGCLGCRMNKADIMITIFTNRNNITEIYLTEDEAIELRFKIDTALSNNKEFGDKLLL